MRCFAIFVVLLLARLSTAAPTSALIPIRIGVVQRYSEPSLFGDSTAFPYDGFQSALYYGVGENDARLNKCGYRYEVQLAYFNRNDLLAAKEQAHSVESDGAWVVLGPTGSHEYLLSIKGLKQTPAISTMAGARAVTDLTPPIFTMYPTIDILAKASVQAVRAEKFGTKYGVFVDASCPSCKDFALEFEKNAGDMQRFFWIDTAGDEPELLGLKTEVAAKRIDFLVLPNYGKLSGFVISKLQHTFPNLKYVGADGWGDEDVAPLFGTYAFLPTVRGIAVRGGRSAKEMSEYYGAPSLHRQFKGRPVAPHFSHYMAVDFLRTLTDDVCASRPKNPEDLRRYLSTVSKDHFRSKSGVGIFQLNGGQLKFSHFLVGLK